jgi:mono/diheme cytochrome c family protein
MKETIVERRREIMKAAGIVFTLMIIISLSFALAYAANTPEERGKALFSDPALGGGTSGKSCNSCHTNGKGLEKLAESQEIVMKGKKMENIETTINFCIVNALKGKGIDPKSEQMKDLVAYVKSLKGKTPAAEAPKKKKAATGC